MNHRSSYHCNVFVAIAPFRFYINYDYDYLEHSKTMKTKRQLFRLIQRSPIYVCASNFCPHGPYDLSRCKIYWV